MKVDLVLVGMQCPVSGTQCNQASGPEAIHKLTAGVHSDLSGLLSLSVCFSVLCAPPEPQASSWWTSSCCGRVSRVCACCPLVLSPQGPVVFTVECVAVVTSWPQALLNMQRGCLPALCPLCRKLAGWRNSRVRLGVREQGWAVSGGRVAQHPASVSMHTPLQHALRICCAHQPSPAWYSFPAPVPSSLLLPP